MRLKFIFFTILITVQQLTAQNYTLQTDLDVALAETSGLIYLNNTLITHNDSGNQAQLFDVDTTTGTITKTVTVTNATNIDWEDITHDDKYIYIGDFGNYQGTRTDLRIYRILISDYFNNTSVTADIINFNYTDQTDFSSNPFDTNFDAEAVIHYNDQLYIFTKNWANNATHIYELPKTPGSYSISQIDSIDSQGLITGADYNANQNSIMLCGYDESGAFLIELKNFSSNLFSNGTIIRTGVTVPSGYSFQTEGIVALNSTTYYISAEAFSSDLQGLYSFNTTTLQTDDMNKNDFTFHPNPAKTQININCRNCETKIFSGSGQLVKTSKNKTIDISDLTTGVYEVEITNNEKSVVKKLIIN